MRKFKYTLLLFVISSISLTAQNLEALKKSALNDAKTAAKATLAKDYKTVLKHTYPSVIELMGGQEKATGFIEATFASMESQGFAFEKAEVVFVSDVVKEQGEYRCYTQSDNVMKMSGMRIYSKSYLLGIYDNAAKIWHFIEAEKIKNSELMKQVMPDFKTDMVIPNDETRTEEIKD